MKPELPDNRVIVPISGNINGDDAYVLINQLAPYVWGFKLHPTTIMRMFSLEHVDIFQFCYGAGARVFVDLKGFDIPSEIANMIRDLEAIGVVEIVTLHGLGASDMIEAAVDARKRIKIFPVTILTSMKKQQLQQVMPGIDRDDQIQRLALVSCSCHADGTISSPADLGLFDENPTAYGNDHMIRCTPGVRPLDANVKGDDQDRVVTPAKAAEAGSDLIVVGRPILQAADPVAAAQAIQSEFWTVKQAA